jgi:hypothetical protein
MTAFCLLRRFCDRRRHVNPNPMARRVDGLACPSLSATSATALHLRSSLMQSGWLEKQAVMILVSTLTLAGMTYSILMQVRP